MKGSIRLIGGIMIALGAAGGITDTDGNVLALAAIAAIGIAIAYSGVCAMNSQK